MIKPEKPSPLGAATIRFDAIPLSGRGLDVEATETERAAIAERLGILSVESFTAHLEARPFRGGVRVAGRLDAAATQACVVTLEPVPETISEPLDRIFLPGGGATEEGEGAETFVDLEGEDLPDHFAGPEIDFAEYLVETLSLALNPYPRAPGAKVEADSDVSGDDDEDNPFAGLKALKTEKD